MSIIDEIWRKKLQKLHFLEMRFLRFFGLLENEKNGIIKKVKISSNDPKFLSRHVKEGYQIQYLDHLDHPGKFFFLAIKMLTRQNFHFLQKTH